MSCEVKQLDVCYSCKSRSIELDDGERVCVDCGLIQNILRDDIACSRCESKDTFICYGYIICDSCHMSTVQTKTQTPNIHRGLNDHQPSLTYEKTKMLELKEYISMYEGKMMFIPDDVFDKVKQKLLEQFSKVDVLKILKSDKELKFFKKAVHLIYYKITDTNPIDFFKDKHFIITEVEKMIRFYWSKKPRDTRNNFNYRYALYYLLKLKKYPVDLKDFPEIGSHNEAKILCDSYMKAKEEQQNETQTTERVPFIGICR